MPKLLRQIVLNALSEDIGTGDISSSLLDDKPISAKIICRQQAVISGIAYAELCFYELDPNINIQWQIEEGSVVGPGQTLCLLKGRSRSMISAERTALNFLQTLSATATQTRHLSGLIAHTKTQLLDTRKTLPNLRHAQKQAVKSGGGVNHRMGLYDCVMLKENHITAIGSLENAIGRALEAFPDKPLIVEVETLDQLDQALAIGGITRILCDNFDPRVLAEAVKKANGKYPLEASGNIDEGNIQEFAETGVDYISIGAITKHIRAVDLSLQFD
jgi:nicotinate-nucleotide pyrophosphorylase (carboxylating)